MQHAQQKVLDKAAIKIQFFRIAKPVISVPMLVPGLNYNFETLVECVSEMGVADQIR